jgi:hypothetical protein
MIVSTPNYSTTTPHLIRIVTPPENFPSRRFTCRSAPPHPHLTSTSHSSHTHSHATHARRTHHIRIGDPSPCGNRSCANSRNPRSPLQKQIRGVMVGGDRGVRKTGCSCSSGGGAAGGRWNVRSVNNYNINYIVEAGDGLRYLIPTN